LATAQSPLTSTINIGKSCQQKRMLKTEIVALMPSYVTFNS